MKKAYYILIQYHIPKLFHANRFTAMLYYTLFSGVFRREMYGVLAGNIGYPDPEGLVAYSEKRPLDEVRTYIV